MKFISKSRGLARNKIKVLASEKPAPIIIKTDVKSNFIAWMGNGFSTRSLYGFQNVDISNFDLSILTEAKLLIVIHSYYSKQINAAVNFSCEYGIPVLWIGDKFPPKDKMQFFDAVSNNIYWELICQTAR